jgi:hypothetical protein
MEFRKYDKIHRLGKDEVEGILDGTVHVEEKVDGANLSVWLGHGGEIRVGSRNNDLTKNGNDFNGAVHYCNTHPGIRKFLEENTECRLYGEWLVKHTIDYNPTSYKKFYVFDIYRSDNGFLDTLLVQAFANTYGIDAVPFLATLENPTIEQLNSLMGKSKFGDRGEGIVIKRPGFVNQFGDHSYAKLVSESFKEDNGVTFGGNNKFSDTYEEMYIVNKFIDVVRVKKVMDKLQPTLNEKLDMKHIPRIISTVYHDLIQEEGWTIASNKKKIDFSVLNRVAGKKIRQVYVDILNNTISVADSK